MVNIEVFRNLQLPRLHRSTEPGAKKTYRLSVAWLPRLRADPTVPVHLMDKQVRLCQNSHALIYIHVFAEPATNASTPLATSWDRPGPAPDDHEDGRPQSTVYAVEPAGRGKVVSVPTKCQTKGIQATTLVIDKEIDEVNARALTAARTAAGELELN
ncbi:hypothetical protein BC938DRAFT_471999 [Jimgerdemannia flammicorona]|uniref:Uncharacterized protein n=1 Tax=Jimgerdemannia flammicorona TaxID=994334 RepID=A0A433QZY8_9FUNG|nr:hypothetical protein BC938DRAFT_471999 [Jimgerdemannia flammicorona]